MIKKAFNDPKELEQVKTFCNDNCIPYAVEGSTLIAYTTLKALRASGQYLKGINYNGNKKLQNTETVKYIIWNIPALITCPYATPACKKYCYAKKSEYLYPNVKQSRANNFKVSHKSNFAKRMIYTLGVELFFSNRYMNVSEIRYRIHESGDFYNAQYTGAWLEIINYFKGYKKLVFDCYTKSLVYFEGVPVNKMRNFAFKASVWADTTPEQIALIKKNHYAVYTADTMVNIADTLNKNKNAALCRCADCAGCNLCAHVKAGALILCAIH